MKLTGLEKLQMNLDKLNEFIDNLEDKNREKKIRDLYEYFNSTFEEEELDGKCQMTVRQCIIRDIDLLTDKYIDDNEKLTILNNIRKKFLSYFNIEKNDIKRDENGNIIYIRKNGDEYYYKNVLHRDNDLPAVKWSDGSKMWYQNGKLHRPEKDGPAVIEKIPGGIIYKKWYIDGKLHRINGPAIIIIYNDGSKEEWYRKEWYQNGKLHRPEKDGPAIEKNDGTREYYINGEKVKPLII